MSNSGKSQRRVLGSILLGSGLVLGGLRAQALAQVAVVMWDQASYDQLAAADSSDTIPPGTKITMQNWQQYKKFMPIGMQALWQGNFYWKMPSDAVIEVGSTQSISLFLKDPEATEKYSSQVKLVPTGDGGY